MTLPVTATVYEPMYDYNEKKYIRVSLPDKVRDYIRELHEHKTGVVLFPQKLDDPLAVSYTHLTLPTKA